MHRILDAADAVYWWLRHHLAVAAGLVAAVVLLLVGLATLTGSDDGPSIPSGAVAVVGDAPITEAQLSRWQAIYAKGAAGANPEAAPSADVTRKAAFQLLAGSTYILEEAEREEVKVPDAEVTKGIDAYFTQSGATTPDARAKILTQLGIQESDLRYQQRVSLLSNALRDRVADRVPQPAAAAVKAAYEADPQRWATPSERDLRVVVSADEATAKRARAALDDGTSFADAAQQFSADAAVAAGKGVVDGLKPGANAAALERPVFAAPVGELQGPIEVDGGWMVFKVQSAEELPERDLAAATPAIRRDLRAVEQADATNRYVTGLRERWKAKTRCMPTVAVPEFCTTATA